jgi:mevalonate kinase
MTMTGKASAPCKSVIAGAYQVLDGLPGLAVALAPRIRVAIDDSAPAVADPFGLAVLERAGLGGPAGARSAVDLATEGWGIGSSAAWTAALTLAVARWQGRNPGPAELFEAARDAHFRAQGGLGSGLDVAACTFGGAVVMAAGSVTGFSWPADVGLVLVRTGVTSDTRAAIRRYLAVPRTAGRAERGLLAEAVRECADCLGTGSGPAMLDCLARVAALEAGFGAALGLPIVLPIQDVLAVAVREAAGPEPVVVKALGAGGGDSLGVLYLRSRTDPARMVGAAASIGLEARIAEFEDEGVAWDSRPD